MDRTFEEYSAAINDRPYVWGRYSEWADVLRFAEEAAQKRRQQEEQVVQVALARLEAADRALRDAAREAVQALEARTDSPAD